MKEHLIEYDIFPGPPACGLSVSERLVYAVTVSGGELMVRHGISRDNPAGQNWKKIPGTMQTISGNSDLIF